MVLLAVSLFPGQALGQTTKVDADSFTQGLADWQYLLDTVLPHIHMITEPPAIPVLYLKQNCAQTYYSATYQPPTIWFPCSTQPVADPKRVDNPLNWTFFHEYGHQTTAYNGQQKATSKAVKEGMAEGFVSTLYWWQNQQNPSVKATLSLPVSYLDKEQDPRATGGMTAFQAIGVTGYSGASWVMQHIFGGDFRAYITALRQAPAPRSFEDDLATISRLVPILPDGEKPAELFASLPELQDLKGVEDGMYAGAQSNSSWRTDPQGRSYFGSFPILTDYPVVHNIQRPFEWTLWKYVGGVGTKQEGYAFLPELYNVKGEKVSPLPNEYAPFPDLNNLPDAGYKTVHHAAPQENPVYNDSNPKAVTYNFSLREAEKVYGQGFWLRNWTCLYENGYGWEDFGKLSLRLVTKPGDPAATILDLDGMYCVQNNNKDPFVITDGLRSRTFLPEYWRQPSFDSPSTFRPWAGRDDRVYAVADNATWEGIGEGLTVLVPGSIYALFGSKLADASYIFDFNADNKLPTESNGLKVTARTQDGKDIDCPMYFTSSGQANFQAPMELLENAGQRAFLTVFKDGKRSNLITVQIGKQHASLYSVGSGAPAALETERYTLITANNPVQPGKYVAFYCNGLGDVRPRVETGKKVTVLAAATDPVTFFLKAADGTLVPMTTSWTGLAPNFTGLGQVNAQVPDVPSGDYPIFISQEPGKAPVDTKTILPVRR